jgi:hypothetical protein
MIIKALFCTKWNAVKCVYGCSVKIGLRTLVLTLSMALEIFKAWLIRIGRVYSGYDRTVEAYGSL